MDRDPDLQAGTLTLLLTDVEGSSQLWERHPEAMKEAVARHDRIIHGAVRGHNGLRPLEQGEGDSTLTAFMKPSDALACVLEIQRAFSSDGWPYPVSLRVRAALHTGEVELRDERRYWGSPINRCARLRGIAHGGQTLLSRATYELLADRLPDEVSVKDLGIHHLRDLSTPEHVYQLCHPDIDAEFPPLLSLEAYPNNLPIQLKSFVSREPEMREVRRRLDAHRLVTLTGAGGSGKTRLALHVAAETLERFPGGVWFVDLAPVHDPDLLLETVAKAVKAPILGAAAGAAGGDRRSLLARVVDYLQIRKTLLILDNCEHLIDACSDLSVTLLQSCPDLRLLVTSREPLGVDGESAWRVPSLSIPSPRSSVGPDDLESFQAVRLFVDRAKSARSDFRVTPDNASAIADISRRFDGIPLAIELAAARVNVLSPTQIASMLGDQFRLLSGGSRKALERQQTMRASIDWSYRYLSDAEQSLLRRLSVFAGGATLEAVEAVCSDDALPAQDVLDHLSHLVQKSLLEVSESSELLRYRLLEMIRQYAREKLNDAGESETVRSRHRDFFMRFADEAEHQMRSGRDETPWLDGIAAEYENIRVAIDWSIDRMEKEQALKIVSALWPFWWFRRSFGQEAWSLLEQSLGLEGEVSPEVLGRAYVARAYAAALAKKSFEERRISGQLGAEVFRSAAPTSLEPVALIIQAVHTTGESRWELFDRAARVARQLADDGDEWALGLAFISEGIVAHQRRDHRKARSLLEKGRDIGVRHGSVLLYSDSDIWLIPAAMAMGDHAGARRYAEEELELWRKRNDELRVAHSLNSLGYISMAQNRLEEARAEIAESLALLQKLGDASSIASVTHSLGEAEETAGHHEAARSYFSESLELSRKSGNAEVVKQCLWGLSRLARDAGEVGQSLRLLTEVFETEKDPVALIPWVRRLAQAMVDAGAYEEAARLFGARDARVQEANAGAIPRLEMEGYEKAVHRAREALGEETFSASWNDGVAMGFETAFEEALKTARAIAASIA